MTLSVSSPQFWDSRYLQNDTGWDMGEVSPPLKGYFDQLKDKSVSILIPGCGNSHEAGYLLQEGFTHITLLDISDVLVASLQEQFSNYPDPPLHLLAGDFFGHEGQFDLIIEQTFFCAIDPGMRKKYFEKMRALLKPGGKLAGLLFDREFEGGPPFGGSEEEYSGLIKDLLHVKTLEPCYNSIPPRAGTELFLIAEKIN